MADRPPEVPAGALARERALALRCAPPARAPPPRRVPSPGCEHPGTACALGGCLGLLGPA